MQHSHITIYISGNNPNMNPYTYDNTFRSVDSPENEYMHQPNFEIPDQFYELDDFLNEDSTFLQSGYPQNPEHAAYQAGHASSSSINLQRTNNIGGDMGLVSMGVGEKIAFKTKSEVEILDDGFKWRKYGKKMVKTSPNPRNYYKCSVEGCTVKKRVERDVDPHYVITTYDGVHNHESLSKS